MVNVYCDNEKCEYSGDTMTITEEDSRQEWYEATYECQRCGKIKVHRREFDQLGMVTSDEITDDYLQS